MSKRGNALFVAAHPDDIEYGCGGTALLLAENYDLHFVVLTSGQRGIRGTGPDEAAAIREKEQTTAAEMMGAQLTLMRQMDGALYAGRTLCEEVGRLVADIRPAVTFALWPLTVADHSAAYEVAQKALHFADMYYTTELYLYETSIGGQSNQFKPDVYVNITDVMERKLEALRCHVSQVSASGGESVRRNGRFRGMEARVEYAEAFCSVHALINSRWERRAGCMLLDL